MMFAWSLTYPMKGKGGHSREREHVLSTLRSFRFNTWKQRWLHFNIPFVTSENEIQH